MLNLVAINLPHEHNKYLHNCHKDKCPNPGRYQLFSIMAEGDLPDWEGVPICSKHLVEEVRHRPEITMSLIDMLIDTLEQHHLFLEAPVPMGPSGRQIIPFRR